MWELTARAYKIFTRVGANVTFSILQHINRSILLRVRLINRLSTDRAWIAGFGKASRENHYSSGVMRERAQ